MRREVLGTAVRLDFDDPRFAPPGPVLADQPRSEQPWGDLFGRSGQAPSIDDGQAGGLV
jgi:hypothetical protein